MAVVWRIGTMERDLVQGDNTNIVTALHWLATGEDENGNSKQVAGKVNVTLAGTPIPYADITEEQAIQWTKDALGAEKVASIESEVSSPTAVFGKNW